MKLTIEPTDQVLEVNGVPARQWEGYAEDGTPVVCLITRVAVPESAGAEAHARFARELQEKPPPSASVSFPLRLIL